MRAGLGMVDPMLDLLPEATVHHIGMYRSKASLLPVQYYNRLPKEHSCDLAIVLEPMIATGYHNADIFIFESVAVVVIFFLGVTSRHNQCCDRPAQRVGRP